MRTCELLKPKYGRARTFSRFAAPRGRLQLVSNGASGRTTVRHAAASRLSSMTDRRKEGNGTGDFQGEGSRHRPSATTAAQMLVEDEAHDRQSEVIRKGPR
jgi:hypothetical protein